MKKLIKYAILTAGLIGAPLLSAATIEVAGDTRSKLGLIIYNQNLAMVNDTRTIVLPQGHSTLNFQAISPQINPASAVLHPVPEPLRIVRQHFQAVTTPGDLLAQSVGQMVTLASVDPVSGQSIRERAKIISVSSGLIFEIDGHFETDLAARRIIYDQLPEGVTSPTLSIDIESTQAFEAPLSLSYLTHGVSWEADYIARLNPDLNTMQLRGLASLQNDSGVDFPMATISLIAGSINQVQAASMPRRERVMMAADASAAPPPAMAMADLQRYELPGRVNLGNNSRWQVLLFDADDVPVNRHYRLEAGSQIYYSKVVPEQHMNVDSYIEFENLLEHHLGLPLPAGTMRLYVENEDETEGLSFIGEDRIRHTPEKAQIRLKTGQAFNLTATRHQLAFKRLPVEQPYRQHFEIQLETRLRNAGQDAVMVEVAENFNGEWLLKEGVKPHSSQSRFAIWKVLVPAQGEAVLKLKVSVKN